MPVAQKEIELDDGASEAIKNKGASLLLVGVKKVSGEFIANQVIDEIPGIDGILAYSLFQMPENRNDRLKFYKKIISKNGEIHFALEGFVVSSNIDIEKVENIWLVKKTMPSCLQSL